MALRIEPLDDSRLASAAALLAARHAAHRAHEPLLPALGDPEAAVRAALGRDGASGAVALRDGRVVAYLIGRLAENDVWGRHAFVDDAGHAASEPETVRDLYAALAPAWVDAGARLQFVIAPAVRELADPWFRLAFGHMQVYALRPSGASAPSLPDGVRIRRGTLQDVEAAPELQPVIWRHQRAAPVFTGLAEPSPDVLRADWEETLAEPDAAYWVLERDGRVVAHALLLDAPPGLGRPERTQHLSALATLPEVRGLGLGVLLSDHVFRAARDAGFDVLDADWRMANLEASRFWPRRGFRETFWRLHRVVGSG